MIINSQNTQPISLAGSKERNVSYDIMNILACISVIGLHHNGLVHTFKDTLAWRQSLVVECALYWAVPVFFMLSGATLIGFRERYSVREHSCNSEITSIE